MSFCGRLPANRIRLDTARGDAASQLDVLAPGEPRRAHELAEARYDPGNLHPRN